MKNLGNRAFVVVLGLVLSISAWAQTPPCFPPAPGETSAPPCTGAPSQPTEPEELAGSNAATAVQRAQGGDIDLSSTAEVALNVLRIALLLP